MNKQERKLILKGLYSTREKLNSMIQENPANDYQRFYNSALQFALKLNQCDIELVEEML